MTIHARKTLSWLPLLLGLGLSGCASEPAATTYLLPSTPASTQHDSRLSVMIAPITVAAFLDGDGIVMQLDDIQVHQARHHLWAEALRLQLQQRLQSRLNTALPQGEARLRGQPPAPDLTLRELRVQLDSFQGRFDGMALIRGHWQLLDSKGELLSRHSFRAETPLTEDGYPALVRALATGWEQVADQLAGELAAGL